MTPEEIQDFWSWVYHYREIQKQRMGQAFMNALYKVAPVLYFDVSQTQYDVFYSDTSQDLYRFRDYLGI